jgi:hypothetical protein
MAFVVEKGRSWSAVGLKIALWSTALAVFLGLADGVFKGPLSFRYGVGDMENAAALAMFATWSYDLRQTFDGLIYIGALIFIGAKFFETRTVFSVGFDNLDGGRVQLKGPDDDNIVWIGHRYSSNLEAQTVASAIEERLKGDTAA